MTLNHPKDLAIIEGLRRIGGSIEYYSLETRITGAFDANGNLYADPQVGLGGDSGQIWVHDEGTRSAVPAILGDRMIPFRRSAGLRCQVGLNPAGELVAIAPLTDSISAATVAQVAAAEKLADMTPAENVSGGVLLAPDDGSLGVFIEADPVIGWAGGVVEIDSGDIPTTTNERGWLVWYYPAGETTPTYAATTPVVRVNKEQQALSEARNYVLPAGAKRIGASTVFEGQTGVTYNNTRFENLRDWLTPEGVGFIQSIVAGTNVTVDDTDPTNPVVSATGSGGTLTGSTVFLTSDVNLTNADTYYDIVSASLVAGTYLISATALYNWTSGTSQVQLKLWDGSTAYAAMQGLKALTGNNPHSIVIAPVIVTLGSTTTVKVSAASQAAGAVIYATPTNNATGLTNLGSYMTYVKIA